MTNDNEFDINSVNVGSAAISYKYFIYSGRGVQGRNDILYHNLWICIPRNCYGDHVVFCLSASSHVIDVLRPIMYTEGYLSSWTTKNNHCWFYLIATRFLIKDKRSRSSNCWFYSTFKLSTNVEAIDCFLVVLYVEISLS